MVRPRSLLILIHIKITRDCNTGSTPLLDKLRHSVGYCVLVVRYRETKYTLHKIKRFVEPPLISCSLTLCSLIGNQISDEGALILAACYQLAQSVLKIGSALAERVGQGEVGGCTALGGSTWRLLQLAVEKHWSVPGGPFVNWL